MMPIVSILCDIPATMVELTPDKMGITFGLFIIDKGWQIKSRQSYWVAC